MREWTIQEVARAAGTTSRALRHYGDLGLLTPSRVGSNGYRYYDAAALVRLQRIMLLRDLGLGLAAVAEVLDGQRNVEEALREHLRLLEAEAESIGRRIASVRRTLETRGEGLMPHEVFDGFDHAQHEEEVVRRWGRDAYDGGDRWWRSLSDEEKAEFRRTHERIAEDYGRAHAAGATPDDEVVQAIARRHVEWLSRTTEVSGEYLVGLGEMYVADPRFRWNYDRHGDGTAELVRDALAAYAAHHLPDEAPTSEQDRPLGGATARIDR